MRSLPACNSMQRRSPRRVRQIKSRVRRSLVVIVHLSGVAGMERLHVVTLLLLLATSSGAQLQSSVERPCPGETVTFTCTVPSLGHGWEIPSLNISRDLVRRNKNKVFPDPPFQFSVTEVRTGTSITSTATVNATEDLNGTLVMCQDGFKKVYPSQNSTINIIAPPAAPGTPSVMISNSRQEFIVKWDEPPLSMGETVDTYFVNISGPSALCGSTDTLQKVNARKYTCLIKTEPQEDETVIIRVQAANCGGNLIGPESEAVSVSFQAPPLVTTSRPITAHPTTTHPTTTHPTATHSVNNVYIDAVGIVSIIVPNLHVMLGMTFALSILIYEHCCRTNAEKDSVFSMVRRILILSILCLTVVGIPLAIVLTLLYIYLYFHKSGRKVEDVKPKDKIPASFTNADPNTIQPDENPGTRDFNNVPSKGKRTHKPKDHLPTYQDPGASSHEAAPTGELYTVPDKKKGAKKKKQPQASRPSEEQLAEMYSQPDKSRKQQSQGLVDTLKLCSNGSDN